MSRFLSIQASVGETCTDCTNTSYSDIFDNLGTSNILALGSLAAAIFVALISHRLLFKILQKTTLQMDAPVWQNVVAQARGVARFGLIVLAVKLTLPLIKLSESLSATLSHLILICLLLIGGRLASLVVNTLTDFVMSRHRVDVDDNLEARKIRTRLKVLRQAVNLLIFFITIAAILTTYPSARSIGVSLFASAGVAGIIVGLAARPVLSNLLAGLQIALTQPIRIDDAVVIEGEWGWIEEITPTYVVVRIWDWRRLIVPLSYVIEHPFQNWTRENASIIGSVVWHTDYRIPVEAMRKKLLELLQACPHWDGNVQVLQVIAANKDSMELRALMSAKNSPTAWDLRCEIREKMVGWLQTEYPGALPRHRLEVTTSTDPTGVLS